MEEVPMLEELRPGAFAVAYRMLGSVTEAEDIVQEALLRLHLKLREGERIESPSAYLSTVVTRLSIDHLRSARVRRESYVGEWLPEPLVQAEAGDPAEHAELADSLSFAFLVLLESLTPEQRAAFLLRDVFDYSYDRIAAIIGTGEENTRQLVARARKRVNEGRPRFEASEQRREQLAHSFLAALENGDLQALEELLAPEGDAGGRALRGLDAAPGQRQRPTRRCSLRCCRQGQRGHGARHRRGRSRPSSARDQQPRQAASPR
jgi:RNA polymerase sigma factor (sigma-70 family)